MKHSHLLDLFLSNAWNLHGPVYDRLSNLLQAHVLGLKGSLRVSSLEDDDADPAAEPVDESASDALLPDGVALIDVRGVLAMHADEVNGACMPRGRSFESIQEQLATAVADPAVRCIVLRLETPGGSAAGCRETFDAIRAACEIKQVHAFLTGYCFSAGVYIASACATVVAASPMTDTGSIGTIAATWDTSGAAKEQGVERKVWRYGEFKALIQDGEKISDVAFAEQQRVVDSYGADFHAAVREGRGLTDAQASAVLNGRTFMASEAVSLGLVDRIQTFPEFLSSVANPSQEPAMFGLKKKPAPAGSDTTTTPAAAGTAQESTMDTKTQAALADLSKSHPALAADLVAAAAQPGATPESLHAIVAQAQAKAKDDQIAALQKQLADAQAAHTSDLAAKIKVIEAKDAEIVKYKRLAGIADQAPQDVGGDRSGTSAKTVRRIPMSKSDSLTVQDAEDIRNGRAVFFQDAKTADASVN